MTRRRYAMQEPPSRAAIWSRRLALFGFAVVLLALILVRGGFVETLPGVAVLMSGIALAAVAMLLALAAFVVIWRKGPPGFGQALLAFVIGASLVVYPAYIGVRSYRLPAISDITTDTADPPRFEAIARLRPRNANPVTYPGAETARKQREAYPGVMPLLTPAPPDDAYAAALEVIGTRKWAVVEARTPQAGRREGRIEAVARTPVMGFRDDVVVRVKPDGTGARVDIRSASRYGGGDLGSNARRIRALLDEIEEMVGAQPAASR